MTSTERRLSRAAMRLFAERGSAEVTLSELASAAGVARGTVYRHAGSVEGLLDAVVGEAAVAVQAGIGARVDEVVAEDPVGRLATGVRLLVRTGHEDADLGRFVVRFGLSAPALREVLVGPAVAEVERGVAEGALTLPPGGPASVVALLVGVSTSSLWMVLDGRQGWREAGAGAAFLVLRALGVDEEQARHWAGLELPG